MLCLALDHEATELYSLKAAETAAFSCDCPPQELAGRGASMLAGRGHRGRQGLWRM